MLMVVPDESETAARAAAVAGEGERESRTAEAAEFIRPARSRRDLPTRARDARCARYLVAEHEAERTTVACREREPPRSGEVRRVGKFRHHGRERTALQRLFHGEQRIDRTL